MTVIVWPLWRFSGKSLSRSLSLFDLTQSSLSVNSFSLEHLSKLISDSCLMSQLLEVVLTVRANNKWKKILRLSGGRSVQRRFWKALTFQRIYRAMGMSWVLYVPRKKPENALTSHPWLTLRLYAIRKWRLRDLNCLPKYMRHASKHKLSPSSKAERLPGFRHLKKYISPVTSWPLR